MFREMKIKKYCNWKFEICGYIFGQPTGVYFTTCGKMPSDFTSPGKFCKYCGKPIKLVKDLIGLSQP